MCGMFNLDVWDSDAEYIVIDDFDFDFFPGMRKALWGAQKEFVATDKFKRKRSLKWGKPMIWLCNPGKSPFLAEDKRGNLLLRGDEHAWYTENCVQIEIANKLY